MFIRELGLGAGPVNVEGVSGAVYFDCVKQDDPRGLAGLELSLGGTSDTCVEGLTIIRSIHQANVVAVSNRMIP